MDKQNQNLINGGLKLEPKDPRNFPLGAVYNLPKLSELPKEFVLEAESDNQRQSDFCTAFGTCLMSGLQEGFKLAPEWNFAVSKLISGDPEGWGQGVLPALKAHTKYGALRKEDSPFSLKDQTDDFLRRMENWPEELRATSDFKPPKALPQKKQSYFEVVGPYDHFDNIRAAIWLFREFKRAVGIGLIWSWPIDLPIIPAEASTKGSGHFVPIVGWKEIDGREYLVAQNNYGPGVGDNGKHYIPREVINPNVDNWGAYMFVDMPKDTAEFLVNNNLSVKWKWLAEVALVLKKIIFSLFR